MEPISRFADAWMPVFIAHMIEVSAFILLIYGVDRVLRLNTRLRYALYLLALAKVFIPPAFSLPAPLPEALPVQVSLQPVLAGLRAVEKTGSSRLSILLFGAWVGSVLLLTGIVIRQNLIVRRCLRRASPVPIPSAFLLLQPTVHRLEVFSGRTVQTPTFVGFLRPRLYLPEDWETWPKDHLRSVLAHEMAHHHARDLWVLALQTLAVVLFGLNPLVWALHTRLTHIRELRCDEAAIDQTGIHPVAYSRVLLAFVERQGSPPLPGLTGISFSENSCTISGRFNHVLGLSSGTGRGALWHYAVPVLLGLTILPLSCRWEGLLSTAFEETVVQRISEAAHPPGKAERAPSGTAEKIAPASRIVPTARRVEKTVTPVASRGAGRDLAGATDWADKRVPPVAREERPAPSSQEAAPPVANGVQTAAPSPVSVEDAPPAPPEPEARRETPMERPPELLKPLNLTYPEIALQSRTEGEVEVRLYVTRTGEVRDVKVMSGPVMFHEAARKAAWDSVWRPAVQNGAPVDVWVACPIRFMLREREK